MKTYSVQIPVDNLVLDGDLTMPNLSLGVVLFAHGSGSSRHSPRNRYVADVLSQTGLSTLLLDLLTHNEEAVDERTQYLRFDIPLLAHRLIVAVDWLATNPNTSGLRIGLFGASTGAGAALVAASERPSRVRAVVSRGGRPDLAYGAIANVESPTLLIVGEKDDIVIRLNQEALFSLHAQKALKVIPGASHLFEESGTLEQVAALARDWFVQYLIGARRRA